MLPNAAFLKCLQFTTDTATDCFQMFRYEVSEILTRALREMTSISEYRNDIGSDFPVIDDIDQSSRHQSIQCFLSPKERTCVLAATYHMYTGVG